MNYSTISRIVTASCVILLSTNALNSQALTNVERINTSVDASCKIQTEICATGANIPPQQLCIELVLDNSGSMSRDVTSGAIVDLCVNSTTGDVVPSDTNQSDCEGNGNTWLPDRLDLSKFASTYFLNRLDAESIDYSVGLVIYDQEPTVEESIGSSPAHVTDVKNAIDAMSTRSSDFYYTNIAGAARLAQDELEDGCADGSAPIQILLSDGVPNRRHNAGDTVQSCSDSFPTSDNNCTLQAVAAGQESVTAGTQLYTIGLDLDSNVDWQALGITTLERMVNNDPNNYFNATPADLVSKFEDIINLVDNTVASSASFNEELPACWTYVSGSSSGVAPNATQSGDVQTLIFPMGTFQQFTEKCVSYQMEFNVSSPNCPNANPAVSVNGTNSFATWTDGNNSTDSENFGEQNVVMGSCVSILPVELTNFDATVSDFDIELNWETASEFNNAGFKILHSSTDSPEKELSFVEGMGSSTETNSYTYHHEVLQPGTHFLKLVQVDYDGTQNQIGQVEVSIEIPHGVYIGDAYPNPFNPAATISFGSNEDGPVNVLLYDMQGQMITSLFSGEVQANDLKQVNIDGSNLSSGAYIVRVLSHNDAKSASVFLLK